MPFFQVTGEGAFCFPVDLKAAGLDGVQDGTNVTLQFVFDGGDGELFQVRSPHPCARRARSTRFLSARTSRCGAR